MDFYNPFKLMSFSNDNCFLCGTALDDSNRTDEHIFPKWLQQKYNLWNQTIHLLNRTTIPYRQLTVPCCKACNGSHLSSLEADIKCAVDNGYGSVTQLEELKIYQWLVKIFYGLLFKELSLLINRKDPNMGPIMTPEWLGRYRTLHGFLQSVRVPFIFPDEKPWSIFIVETIAYPEPENNFDYHDGIAGLTFSIRMGNVGIIAALEDGGAQKTMFDDHFAALQGIELHPVQFSEMAAKVGYKSALMNRVPRYMNILPSEEGHPVYVFMQPIQGISDTPIFEIWDQWMFARLLAGYWYVLGVKPEDIFREPNQVISYLETGDSILLMNPDGTLKGYRSPGFPKE